MSVFHKSKVTAIVAIVVACGPSSAFAQARAWEGCVLPFTFGSQGERHYYVNGYSGPMDPPMGSHDNVLAAKRMPRGSATK
jgi:hypothetical protein